MERKPNKLRTKLSSTGYVTGSAMFSWSPNVIEVAGHVGLDFMRIDNEHAWRQDSSVEHLLRAAHCAGIVPIIRVDKDNPYLIRKALETGAGGIIVPDVHTPEQAAAVVMASKFPPRGTRGYSGNCWSAGWGTAAGREWVEWSDTEPMIGVMIENHEAMLCIDEILATDGLDFVLFGPADFSMSLGWRQPAKESDEIQEALKRTIKAAKKAGKHVMLGVGAGENDINKYREMGVTMFELASDLKILANVWHRARNVVELLGESGQ